MSQSSAPATPNYLLFSDVHLGADLVQHARPWTAERLCEQHRLDRDLSAMLAHYREHRDPERPWTLVIAGDLIDLIGMSIVPGDGVALETPLTEEERLHGLGTAGDHVAFKVRAVAGRHDALFRSLAAFVADGHGLVLVRGNHDVEMYWEQAQRAFVEELLQRCEGLQDDPVEREAFESRVEFRDWFFYVEHLLYVEHGHQYDSACAYRHVLSPLSPSDPRRLVRSFSDILLRYVVLSTRGLSAEGHEKTTLGYYLRLAFSMGVGGCYRLGARFFRAVFAMIATWWEHLGDGARALRAEHDRRMALIAQRFRLSEGKVRKLASLWATPVTAGFLPILRSVFLDVVAACLVTGATLGTLLLSGVLDLRAVGPLAVFAGLGMYLYLREARHFDPSDAMRKGASHVARILPARYVVMGHTHVPRLEAIEGDSTYVNLGGWAADDLDDTPQEMGCPPAPCTYLVIRHVDGEPTAELRRWDSELGATLLDGTAAGAESGVHLRPGKADRKVA
ncbi:MAG: metallophosphoesterase [Myxococcales bacterium]|jgi:UDP-2,3-diacylglucosamine pyrophosphatase LpxH